MLHVIYLFSFWPHSDSSIDNAEIQVCHCTESQNIIKLCTSMHSYNKKQNKKWGTEATEALKIFVEGANWESFRHLYNE